ncbi:MAG: pur operon repressor [Anaerovoracaceae bacterium]
MKRIGRVSYLIKTLSDSPNVIFPLSVFTDKFNIAKSSVSEDISKAKEIVQEMKLGKIETISGIHGGVKFTHFIDDEDVIKVQKSLCKVLKDENRFLGGGFLYTSDIMFNPVMAESLAKIFARKFQNTNADYIATIETKGIPLAMMTAKLLNIPLIVVRRETKISEGSTVSINYFSGSSDRIQKMSMSKRSIKGGSKALIIDDFMRAGGSIKGITELLSEFSISVVGVGVAIVSDIPINKKISNYTPLIYMGEISKDKSIIELSPNFQIF